MFDKIKKLEKKTENNVGIVNDLITTLEESSEKSSEIISGAEAEKERITAIINQNKRAKTFCDNILKIGSEGLK